MVEKPDIAAAAAPAATASKSEHNTPSYVYIYYLTLINVNAILLIFQTASYYSRFLYIFDNNFSATYTDNAPKE